MVRSASTRHGCAPHDALEVQAEAAAKAEAAAMQLRQAEHEIGELQQQARPRIQQNATYKHATCNIQRATCNVHHVMCNMQAGRGRRRFKGTENEWDISNVCSYQSTIPCEHARNCTNQALNDIGI